MPDDPVTANPWEGNRWQRDTGRETAVDAERAGGVYGWAAAAGALQDAAPVGGTEDATSTQSPGDAYSGLIADWPRVPPLVARHVGGADFNEVYDYWYEHWRNPRRENDKLWCFDWAQYQLHVAKFRGTGDGRDPSTYFQLFVESDGGEGPILTTDVARTVEAVQYLKNRLQHGVPVLIGIRLANYPRDFNPDKTTNHYVVVVGMDVDAKGPYGATCYFSYYDYLYKSTLRFYLYSVPTLALYSTVDDTKRAVVQRRVSQVRYTVAE
ncbi:MAG: hypothetical protein R2745_17490 [Vicinamibacterales bacterium]